MEGTVKIPEEKYLKRLVGGYCMDELCTEAVKRFKELDIVVFVVKRQGHDFVFGVGDYRIRKHGRSYPFMELHYSVAKRNKVAKLFTTPGATPEDLKAALLFAKSQRANT